MNCNKKAVFIAGTNAVGKTSVIREIIDAYGGIKTYKDKITFLNDDAAAVGKYGGCKYGGLDTINETSSLANLIKIALEKVDTVFVEGQTLHTFGLNITNAIFAAPKALWVLLYADIETLSQRVKKRGGRGLSQGMIDKQKLCISSFKKIRGIGVKAIAINTSIEGHTPQKIAKYIINYINNGLL